MIGNPAPGNQAFGWHNARLMSLCALVFSSLHFASFYNPEQAINTNAKFFLYFAYRIAEGDIAHLELFDNKTFLANFVGAICYRIGEGFGFDPLQTIRVAMLSLSSLSGLLTFWIFRRLGQGSAVIGFLGLVSFASFAILGLLPAIGNFPKLLMVLLAQAMALAVARGRWFAAGFLSALAFMDWQIGVFVGVAALGASIVSGPDRVRHGAMLLAGGLVGLLGFGVYFAQNGALGAFLDQSIWMALARGTDTLETTSFTYPLTRISRIAFLADPAQRWLMLVGTLGAPLSWLWIWRAGPGPVRTLLVPLCLYNTLMTAFSLLDFQGYGDFYALTGSIAFWLGILWTQIYMRVRRALGVRDSSSAARIIAGVVLTLAILLGRPLWLRPETALSTPPTPKTLTLTEQRQVAMRLEDRIGNGTFLALNSTEVLFLMRYRNPTPFTYVNVASLTALGDAEEPPVDNIARLIESIDPDSFIAPNRYPIAKRLTEAYTPVTLATADGQYGIVVYERN